MDGNLIGYTVRYFVGQGIEFDIKGHRQTISNKFKSDIET
jgi:hypothetical protein